MKGTVKWKWIRHFLPVFKRALPGGLLPLPGLSIPVPGGIPVRIPLLPGLIYYLLQIKSNVTSTPNVEKSFDMLCRDPMNFETSTIIVIVLKSNASVESEQRQTNKVTISDLERRENKRSKQRKKLYELNI